MSLDPDRISEVLTEMTRQHFISNCGRDEASVISATEALRKRDEMIAKCLATEQKVDDEYSKYEGKLARKQALQGMINPAQLAHAKELESRLSKLRNRRDAIQDKLKANNLTLDQCTKLIEAREEIRQRTAQREEMEAKTRMCAELALNSLDRNIVVANR